MKQMKHGYQPLISCNKQNLPKSPIGGSAVMKVSPKEIIISINKDDQEYVKYKNG